MEGGSEIEDVAQRDGDGGVDALSRHRDIVRRETSFWAREVSVRNLGSMAGKISYLESQSSPPSTQQISMDSSEIKVKLPYLVSNREEALDCLLHESLFLRYRMESLAASMKEFDISISSEEAKKLTLMSRALVWISRRIMRSDAINSRHEEKNGISSSYHKHRLGWESTWGSRTPNHGVFDDITTLSSMQFTSSTPGHFSCSATTGPALQIFSISIVDLHPNLSWPLHVWGVVAARDVVDRNRNILFSRSWADRQELTQDDPFLCLTGPSRAIVAWEDVTFEVELQINYGEGYQQTAVLPGNYRYHSECDDTPEIARGCCTAKVRLEQLSNAIQATILSVKVENGSPTFDHGCKVFCYCFATTQVSRIRKPRKIMLLDSLGEEIPSEYIHLSRKVVSVKSQGTLRVTIQASAGSPEGFVDFPVKACKTSERSCLVGNAYVKVVVAWSLLVTNKENLVLDGYVPM